MSRPLRHPNHKRPITRRDFLAQGFISGAAMVVAPSLFGLFKSQAAFAQAAVDCNLATGAGRIPFVCFDLAGGANIAGSNVLVGGPGGQLDLLSPAGYEKLGLPSTMLPSLPGQVNTELGLAFHADSAFLRGILTKTSATTRANVNGAVICARSENDTGNNPHNPMYGINKAGADGNLVTLIGTEPSDSGGNSVAPMSMIDPAARPTKVSTPSDVTGLVDTGRLAQLLAPQDAAAVMAAVEQISESKLQHMTEDAIVEQLIRCGYVESTSLVSTFGNPALLDPLADANITSIFNGGELNQDKFRKTASVMKLAVNGFAGAGTIEFGGYDYHDGTRATGEVRDFEAGVAIGAVLEYAALHRPAADGLRVQRRLARQRRQPRQLRRRARQGPLARRQPEHRRGVHAGARPGRPAAAGEPGAAAARLLPHERRRRDRLVARRQQRDAPGRGRRAQFHGAPRRRRPLRHRAPEPRPRRGRQQPDRLRADPADAGLGAQRPSALGRATPASSPADRGSGGGRAHALLGPDRPTASAFRHAFWTRPRSSA